MLRYLAKEVAAACVMRKCNQVGIGARKIERVFTWPGVSAWMV